MIDLQDLQKKIEMTKRNRILSQYHYWEASDGRWKVHLPDKKKGRVLRVKKTQKEIEDLIIAFHNEEANDPDVEDVFYEWINYQHDEREKISTSTKERYIQAFNRSCKKEFGRRKIKSLEAVDFVMFLEKQVPELGLSAKAYSNLATVTRGILKYAKRKGYVDFTVNDVFGELDISKDDFDRIAKDDIQEVFNETETPIVIEYLKAHIDECPANACLLLIFVSGIRVGEAVALTHDDIMENMIHIGKTEIRERDENGKRIYPVRNFPKTRAGVRDIVIPSGYEWLLRYVNGLNPDSEWVFLGVRSGESLTTNSVRTRLKTVCKHTEIRPKSPHKARKTYGSILMDAGLDKRFVTDQMGHASIATSESRYHFSRRGIESKQRILDNISDFQ